MNTPSPPPSLSLPQFLNSLTEVLLIQQQSLGPFGIRLLMCLLNNYVMLLKEVLRIGSSQDQKFSACIVSDYLYESKKSVRFNLLSG